MKTEVGKLFGALEEFCQGRPTNFLDSILKIRSWLTDQKDNRLSGYMNHPQYFAAYSSYHMPLHLPELYWILEKNFERLQLTAPKTILDFGCGPGTLTLSSLLWMKKHNLAEPKKINLVDFSSRALEGATHLVKSIVTESEIKTHKVNLQDKRGLGADIKADWIFVGHMLNEWGSGPRVREEKYNFVSQIMARHLNPGGYIFLVEPPLREPTLDLMWLRDAYADAFIENPVVAPCPRGVLQCPMIHNKLGWCYAQPPRLWAADEGLTPWDKEIRKILDIRLEEPGFSYLVIRHPESEPLPEPAPHAIAITNRDAPRMMICAKNGAKASPVTHRGDYLYKG